MAIERRILEALHNQEPGSADEAEVQAFNAQFEALKRRGIITDIPIESLTQENLDAEWQRQADKLIHLGFHAALGMTEVEYLASLPRFTLQPETLKGKFDSPLLVETRLSIIQQAKHAGLLHRMAGANIRDWEDDPHGYVTPDLPYTTWVQDGKKYQGVSVLDVRARLMMDERGGTIHDGIAFFIAYPDTLKHHFVNLPGTSTGSSVAPCLEAWSGGPKLDHKLVNISQLSFGSLTCGREVRPAA